MLVMLTHTRPGPPPAAGMVDALGRVFDAPRELPVGEIGGGFIGRWAGIGAIGGGALGALDVEVVVAPDDQVCTPLCPRHAPRLLVPLHGVPSLQIALMVLVVMLLPAGMVDLGAAAAGEVIGCVEVEVVVALDDQLCTPLCPRHAPRLLVPPQGVPSLQIALMLALVAIGALAVGVVIVLVLDEECRERVLLSADVDPDEPFALLSVQLCTPL